MPFELHFFSNPDGKTVTDNIDAVDAKEKVKIKDNSRTSVDSALADWEAKHPGRKINLQSIQVMQERG